MKQLSLVVVLGAFGFVMGMSGSAQPAKAFGDWFSRDKACAEAHEPRVHYRTVRRRIVKRPGVYVIKRRPGLYGWKKVRVHTRSGRVVWRKKRVLLSPYENIAVYHEPRERWVTERQRIVAAAPPRPRGAWPDGC